jgi:3-phosphoshikimate 1-carboxyvinyltransferase
MLGTRSSQYFSALLLCGGLADGDIEVRFEGRLVSRPYVEITRRMVADFGGTIDERDGSFVVRRVSGYRARAYAIEPDASSASYGFALAAAAGGSDTVPDLADGALQGDYRFVDVLASAGAEVVRERGSTTVRGAGLRGVDVDMHDISDTVMTLAAIAPLASGPTRIRNVANIRIKETDRLAAVATELERLGQGVTQGDDFLFVEPRPIRPALVRTYGDHRMAMSFAVLGAAAGGVSIEDPECVAKTYPGFWDDLGSIYRSVGASVAF